MVLNLPANAQENQALKILNSFSIQKADLANVNKGVSRRSAKYISRIDSTYGRHQVLEVDTLPLFAAAEYDIKLTVVEQPYVFNGDSISISGVIIQPETSKPTPLILYMHGTVVPALKSYVPSNRVKALEKKGKTRGELLFALSFAARGYTVVMPDYIGYGSSKGMDHPYTVQEAEGDAAIALVQSCERTLNRDSSQKQLNGQLFIMGVSEGAGLGMGAYQSFTAAGVKGESRLTLEAVSLCSGPYDYASSIAWLFGEERPSEFATGIYMWSAFSIARYYQPTLSTDSVFRKKYKKQKQIVSAWKLVTGPRQPEKWLNPNFLDLLLSEKPTVMDSAINQNTTSSFDGGKPLYLFHGEQDAVVAYLNSANTFRNLSQRGAKVYLKNFSDRGHITIVRPYIMESIEIFNDLVND